MPLAFGDVDAEHAGIATHVDALHLYSLIIIEYGIHAAAHKHNGLTGQVVLVDCCVGAGQHDVEQTL